MKKIVMGCLVGALTLGGCGTTNPNSLTGVMIGASVGGELGGAIGGIWGGTGRDWYGSYRGSAIGTIVGTVAGAAIGHVITSSGERRSDEEGYAPVVKDARRMEQSAGSRRPMIESPLMVRVKNLRFIDESRNQAIEAGETCKLLFEVMNEDSREVRNVLPVVEIVENGKYIGVSPSVMIERIAPGEGFRYTASLYANRKLKNGQAVVRVALADEEGRLADVKEFSLPTRRK